MSFSFSHPVNTGLLLYILYLLQRIILPPASLPRTPPTEFKGGYSWMPRTHAPSVLFTTYTPRSLSKYSGHAHDGGRILLAIAGTVFDVTAGRGFYGPGKRSLSLQFPTTAKSD
jgi:membrane-associated progesterone receptor component